MLWGSVLQAGVVISDAWVRTLTLGQSVAAAYLTLASKEVSACCMWKPCVQVPPNPQHEHAERRHECATYNIVIPANKNWHHVVTRDAVCPAKPVQGRRAGEIQALF